MSVKQVGGTHYQSSMECWDYILANNLGYLEGTAIKYITRWKKKNGVEDLQKAIHFLQKLIETKESSPPVEDTFYRLNNITKAWVETSEN